MIITFDPICPNMEYTRVPIAEYSILRTQLFRELTKTIYLQYGTTYTATAKKVDKRTA